MKTHPRTASSEAESEGEVGGVEATIGSSPRRNNLTERVNDAKRAKALKKSFDLRSGTGNRARHSRDFWS